MSALDPPVELRTKPFAHTTHRSPLPVPDCEAALTWMETDAPWKLRVASFYEQWELHLEPDLVPSDVRPVLSPRTIEHLIASMLRPITERDLTLTEVTAHKLVPGQTIRIHNDFLEDGETHRVLLQLNRGWDDDQGGLLMLFGGASPEELQRVIRPVHGSATAFAISPESFHAVSTIKGGHRYTLVYSFRAGRVHGGA